MTGENGGTQFIPGSHKISDEEAAKEVWRDVPKKRFAPEEIARGAVPGWLRHFFRHESSARRRTQSLALPAKDNSDGMGRRGISTDFSRALCL